MKKRVLSLLMALVLCFSMLPTAALAEEAGTAQEIQDAADTGDIDNSGDVGGTDEGEDSGDVKTPEGEDGEDTGDNGDAETQDDTAQDTGDGKAPDAGVTDGEADTAVLTAQIAPTAEGETHTAHCVCGGAEDVNGHTHDATTTWTAADSLSGSAGNYYLMQSVSNNWTVTGEVKLCLNGQTITGSITVGSGAKLTLTDCTDSGTVQGGVLVNGGTLELYGGTITGGVQVGKHNDTASGSKFTMFGGVISGHDASSGSGGGVFLVGTTNSNITPPSFTMHGGTISGNTAGASDGGGGGVYVGEKCSFTMDGGTITGNTATGGNGGGIYIHMLSKVTISGGEITNNTATGSDVINYGGGIYSETGVTVSNATITKNTADEGCGIYGKGTIALTDAIVTDNSNYDIYYGGQESTTPKLTVSGSVKVGYYANYAWKLPIRVSGALDGDSVIRVGVYDGIKPGYGETLTIAEPADNVTLNADNFETDVGDCVTGVDEDGAVYLARCAHKIDNTGYTCSKCGTSFDARVGESDYYQTLEEAFIKTEGGTVTLLRDVTLNADRSAAFSSDRTLDLNGKTISSEDKPISVNKKLTIKNSGTNGGAQALNIKLLVRSNGTLAVDDSYTGGISCVELQAGGTLERFGGKIGELVLSDAMNGSTSTGYGLKLWKDNANACVIGKITNNTTGKALTVNDLLKANHEKCKLYGEKDDGTWSSIDKSTKIADLTGYAAYKVWFPECVHACSDDTVENPVCSVCNEELYTKITAKAADGTVKTAYFAENSSLESGYAEAINALNRWGTTGYTDPMLTLLRNMPSGSSMTLTGTLTLAGGTHTARNVTVAKGADVTFASGSYKGATINGTATVKDGVTFTDTNTVTVNGTLNVKGGSFTGVVTFENGSTANISGGRFTGTGLDKVTYDNGAKGTISGGTFTYAEFYTTGVKLTGGKFDKISISGGDKLADLLAEGAYYKGDNAVIDDTGKSLTNVTVVPHTHNVNDTSGVCSICNKQMTAAVTVGGTKSWYVAFASAIEAANAADGEKTITLYQDVDGYDNGKSTTYELTRGSVTLATGGKTVQRVHLIAKGISLTVTGKGSGGSFNVTADGKGAELIVSDAGTKLAYVYAQNGGKLSLSNGAFSGVKVTDDGSSGSLSGGSYGTIDGSSGNVKPYELLAKGYAYKKTEDSTWVSNANITLQKVAVEKAPFAVEKVYPNSDTAYTGSSAIADDGNIKLTAVVTPGTAGVTYQWELLKADGNWVISAYFHNVNDAEHTGADSGTLTITGLPVGSSYQYRVLVMGSDGYQCYSEPFTVTAKAHEHPICGAVCNHKDDNGNPIHPSVKWTAKSSFDGQFLTAGHYYLTDNVKLEGRWVLNGNVDLCLNSHTVSNNAADAIQVPQGKILNLCDCDAQERGKVYAPNSNGGYGVSLDVSTLNLYGGTITGGKYGVYLGQNGSTFNMYGGTIKDSGTGVYMKGLANSTIVFDMTGGTITGNGTGNEDGGGIYVGSGTFRMSGDAKITNNNHGEKVIGAGGVYVGGGTFEMGGNAVISGNSVTVKKSASSYYIPAGAGGVYVASGTFTMSDHAKVTGNTVTIKEDCTNGTGAGGVYVSSKGSMSVSGNTNVTGNTVGNVYLVNDKTITIGESLTKEASIGVTTATAPTAEASVKIATGATGSLAYDKIFTPDVNQNYVVIKDAAGDLFLSTHQHKWAYAVGKTTTENDTITATCSECSASGGSVTIKAPEGSLIYDGNGKAATLDNKLTTGVTVPDIKYYYTGGEYDYELEGDTKPTKAANYKASITVGTDENRATAEVTYTIDKATPKVGDFTFGVVGQLTYDGNAKTAQFTTTKTGMGEVKVKYYQDETEVKQPTNAGTYTVKIDVAESANYNAASGLTADGWKFSISRATLTLNASDFTVTVPQNVTYDGDPKFATAKFVSETKAKGFGKITVKYYGKDGKQLEGAPANAGTYTVKIDVAQGVGYEAQNDISSDSWTFEIKQVQQKLTFQSDKVNKMYGEGSFTNPIKETDIKGGITYTSSNSSVATVDTNGTVTIKAASTEVVTITARTEGTTNYSSAEASYTLTVAKKAITVSGITAADKTYDGKTTATLDCSKATFGGKLDGDTLTVTATGTFADKNVGEDKTVNITDLTLGGASVGNYQLSEEGQQTTATATISPAKIFISTTGIKEKVYDGNANAEITGVTITGLKGNDSLTEGTDYTVSSKFLNASGTEESADAGQNKPVIVEIELRDSVTNYTFRNNSRRISEVSTGTIKQATPTVSANNITVTYDGKAIPADKITGTADVGGTWAWKAGTAVTSVADSGEKKVVFTPNDSTNYTEVEKTITVTIKPATPSGEPGYTKITGSGKTLKDAGLTIGTLNPSEGTLEWIGEDGKKLDDTTVVEANKSYTWRFTPDNKNYGVRTGEIELYHRSSGYYYYPTDTGTGTKTSAGTGDAGLLPYAVTALMSYTGTAALLRRRKRED